MSNKAFLCAAAKVVASAAVVAVALFASCTTEQYDSGDGKLSYLRSDFVEACTDAQSRMSSFTTDEQLSLQVEGTPKVSWMTTPDSTYRALVYYAAPNSSSAPSPSSALGSSSALDSSSASGPSSASGSSSASGPSSSSSSSASFTERSAQNLASAPVNVFIVNNVLCPEIKRLQTSAPLKTDPVSFVALWLSANRKYVNITFDVKTGSSGSDADGQSIGAVLTDMTRNADGTLTAHITFCHDQGNVPQYYSSRQYASLAVAQMQDADSASIVINSYKGKVVKTISLK